MDFKSRPSDASAVAKRVRSRFRYAEQRKERRNLLEALEKPAQPASTSNFQFLRNQARKWRNSKEPESTDLIKLAKEVFPPRMDVEVYVCDMFHDHSKQFVTTLGNIESRRTSSKIEAMRTLLTTHSLEEQAASGYSSLDVSLNFLYRTKAQNI